MGCAQSLMPSNDASERLRQILTQQRTEQNTQSLLTRFTSKKPLWHAMRLLVACDLAAACFLYIVEMFATLVTPVAIYELLHWTESNSKEASRGAVFVIVLAIAAVTAYIADYASERISKRAGVTSRAGVCGLLYRKLLTTPTIDAQSTSSGEIISYFDVDASALVEYWHGLVGLVLQPLEIMGNVGLLFFYVGYAAFGGIAVVIVAMLITYVCGNKVEKVSTKVSELTDIRIRDTYEMLMGMKVVKMNAWEPKFASAIEFTRKKETSLSHTMGRYLAVVNVSSSNSVDVISLAVILVYTLAMGRDLSPSIVFTYWVLLGLLHARIFHYPQALKHVKDGAAAITRLDAYLAKPQREDPRIMITTNPKADKDAVVATNNLDLGEPQAEHASDTITGNITSQSQQPGRALQNNCIVIKNAAFGWQVQQAGATGKSVVLQDIDLQIPMGSFVAVVGPVGSGKSTLLQALLGECDTISGSVEVSTKNVAYVPQTSWILRATAKENIVFNSRWDNDRYIRTVKACCLTPDFESWKDADESNIGNMTVSGGQRQRISLARATYADAQLYVLDDCLSALDQRVTRSVLNECLMGMLEGTTRVMVTNSSAVVESANLICLLVPSETDSESGAYTCALGTLAELQANDKMKEALEKYVASQDTSVDGILGQTAASPNYPPAYLEVKSTPTSLTSPSRRSSASENHMEFVSRFGETRDIPELTLRTLQEGSIDVTDENAPIEDPEFKQSLPFFWSWAAGTGGWIYAVGVAVFLAVEAACVEVGVYWLALWSEDPSGSNFSFTAYIVVYAAFVAGELLAAFIRQHIYVCGTIASGNRLHASLLKVLINAPMHTFDTVPANSLIQWFSREMHHIDNGTFYASEYFWLGLVYGSLIFFVQLFISLWIFIPLAIVAIISLVSFWPRSKPSVSQSSATAGDGNAGLASRCGVPSTSFSTLMLAESKQKGPVLSNITSALEGLTCIRAFQGYEYFISRYHTALDTHSRAWLDLLHSQAFQVLRGNLMGAVYYIGSVAIIVPLTVNNRITPGSAGFIIVNSCFASSMVNLVIEHASSLASLAHTRGQLIRHVIETSQEGSSEGLSAADRSYYGWFQDRMKKENGVCSWVRCSGTTPAVDVPSVTVTGAAPPQWPTKGEVTFENAQMRYLPSAPLVLKGVTLRIAPGCHVGVCGRTGAGKSSLIAALTRLVDLSGGRITVDNVDIKSLSLRELRTGLTVISQEPLFVSGTLRRNLDPFSEFSDNTLLDVLAKVRLLNISGVQSSGTPSLLDLPIAEKGSNLSLGEQQLLAAARSWLRNPKVLLMDEATAALDPKSEELLQDTVRTVFADSTVIQIAHRLQSIVQCHSVVVMDDGRVAEVDHPWVLMRRQDGIFASMVAALPDAQREALELTAKTAFERDNAKLSRLRCHVQLD